MNRADELSFRKDVYTPLIRYTHYRVSGLLNRERKDCANDSIFFSNLTDASDSLIGKAFRSGKMVASKTSEFLNNFRKVITDETAYAIFVHENEVQDFVDELLFNIAQQESRINTVFRKYWRDTYRKSISELYYLVLLMDSDNPKFSGLGPEASRVLYDAIQIILHKVKKHLGILINESADNDSGPQIEDATASKPADIALNKESALIVLAEEDHIQQIVRQTEIEIKSSSLLQDGKPEEAPVIVPAIGTEQGLENIKKTSTYLGLNTFGDDSGTLSFLNYIYDEIVRFEYPAAAYLLSVLKSRVESDSVFFCKILNMDILDARKELGIGEVSAKEVVRLCDMMRSIVSRPGARLVYDESERAAKALPLIEKRISREHIRVYHSYQKFMSSCGNSIMDFYLSVAGLSHRPAKFIGLNPQKSQELLQIFINLLSVIDKFMIGEDDLTSSIYEQELAKFKFSADQIDKIDKISKRIGHFPLFTAIDCSISMMDERNRSITSEGLNLFYGKPPEGLNDIAAKTGVSRERVRQLRSTCLESVMNMALPFKLSGLTNDYVYDASSDYDFKRIRDEEQVGFSNEYITICIAKSNPAFSVIGDTRNALLKSSGTTHRLFLVSSASAKHFDFESFLCRIDEMKAEKRFYPYRDDLDAFVRSQINKELTDEQFYEVVKECRQVLQKGYPENIINSQVFFPANARKTIPFLIEDILREYNHPMTAEEISNQLNERFPDIEQIPSKIGSNALRNNNIIAVGRSSTYALTEWNATEKRGGTIRDIVEEYLNTLFEPIAPLSDISEYVAKFRDNVKESSIKTNLLADTSNKFTLYYKDEVVYIGHTDFKFDDSFIPQEKRQGRRSFTDSIKLVEKFIQDNERFPSIISDNPEEKRLNRFLSVSRTNMAKGILGTFEKSEIERIDTQYEKLKGHRFHPEVKTRTWMENLEDFVTFINQNDQLPPAISELSRWYDDSFLSYTEGTMPPDNLTSFKALLRIVERMSK